MYAIRSYYVANQIEEKLKDMDKNITVAVMGCVVNGPGEAREADIGIAGGDGCAILFKKGEVVRKIDDVITSYSIHYTKLYDNGKTITP